jgi:hypothetical protein
MTEADRNLRRSIRMQLATVPPDTWDFDELTIILAALTEIAVARPVERTAPQLSTSRLTDSSTPARSVRDFVQIRHKVLMGTECDVQLFQC